MKDNGTHVSSVILLTSPNPDHPLFTEQLSILDSLDAEELEFIIIIACLSKTFPAVYHTDTDTALKLGANKFKVLILNGNGKIIKESIGSISKDDLEIILKSNQHI